jgi:uncharacterized protein (DUF779 family)
MLRKGAIMFKKTIVLLVVLGLVTMLVMPIQTYAAPKWWDRLKEIVKADIAGGADGYLQTETIGGAIAGAIKGSVEAANTSGITGDGWPLDFDLTVSIGDLHNSGLASLYERFSINSQKLSEEAWERIDRQILIHLWEWNLYERETAQYLRNMDPTFEAMMKRINEATQNNKNFPVSENFFNNLEAAFSVLDEDAEDPSVLIDQFINRLIESSAKESGEVLSRGNGGMTFSKPEVTYKPQKSMVGNNDIILAQIMASIGRKSYDYWQSKVEGLDDSMDIIVVVPARAPIGVADLVEAAIPPSIKGIEVAINRTEATVGIDDVVLDVAPYIENGRTMVPFRFIGESLGAEIGWNPEESSVSYALGDNTLKLYIGRNSAVFNGKDVQIDANEAIVPKIVNSRTMVPIRFISETLGFNVTWDPERGAVGVSNNPLLRTK